MHNLGYANYGWLLILAHAWESYCSQSVSVSICLWKRLATRSLLLLWWPNVERMTTTIESRYRLTLEQFYKWQGNHWRLASTENCALL